MKFRVKKEIKKEIADIQDNKIISLFEYQKKRWMKQNLPDLYYKKYKNGENDERMEKLMKSLSGRRRKRNNKNLQYKNKYCNT